jgi:bacillithiol system protein YtxJ
VAQIVELSQKSLPDDCYVYKHSTRCPVSASAAGVVRAHTFDLPLYWVNVIEQRDLSNWVAAAYSVAHESPQLLEIRGGKVKKSLSHFEISSKNL